MAAQRNAPLAHLEVGLLQGTLVQDGAYLGRAFEREPVAA
jgi:hypothetical protein